jgi:hypothetical protein
VVHEIAASRAVLGLLFSVSVHSSTLGAGGNVMAKALCYKPEGRRFETEVNDFFRSV